MLYNRYSHGIVKFILAFCLHPLCMHGSNAFWNNQLQVHYIKSCIATYLKDVAT